MNKLQKQIEDLIVSNIPQNLNLRIPVTQDKELNTALTQMYELIKAIYKLEEQTNSITKSMYMKVSRLLDIEERKESQKMYGGKFWDND